MRTRWLGDQATDRLKAKLYGNVDQAGDQLQQAIVAAISTPGPPRSQPGEAPHIDTGELVESWSHETDGIDDVIVTRVGTTSAHALPLEDGTDRMEPRPCIKSTLIDDSDALARTICKQ